MKTLWKIIYEFDAKFIDRESGGFQGRTQQFYVGSSEDLPDAKKLSEQHCLENFSLSLLIQKVKVVHVEAELEFYNYV